MSATVEPSVERLAGVTFRPDAARIGLTAEGDDVRSVLSLAHERAPAAAFELPDGLRHFYAVVPAKMRLGLLGALLACLCGVREDDSGRRSGKCITFFSSCDSVEFHRALFGAAFSLRRAPAPRQAERKSSSASDAGDSSDSDVEGSWMIPASLLLVSDSFLSCLKGLSA